LPADPVREALIANSMDGGHQGAATLLSLASPPTAILAGSGKIALGVMNAARARGIDIPAELSVVAMGDSDLASFTHPQLTTIHIRTEEMGQRGAQILLALIQGKGSDAPVLMRPELVVRGTSAPAP
jgi:LacI family transcriptional regulator